MKMMKPKTRKGCLFQVFFDFLFNMFKAAFSFLTFISIDFCPNKNALSSSAERKRFFAQTRDTINNNDAKETVSFALHLARGGGEKRFEWRRRRRSKRRTTKSNFIKQIGSKTTHAFDTFV